MRILFATLGTYGDLNPVLALGEELRRRGHIITVATNEAGRAHVDSANLRFVPVRPHFAPETTPRYAKYWQQGTGENDFWHEIILPSMLDTYHDLEDAVLRHDTFVSLGTIFLASSLVMFTGTPWVTCAPSPLALGIPFEVESTFPCWVPKPSTSMKEIEPVLDDNLMAALKQLMPGRAVKPINPPPKMGLFSKHLAGNMPMNENSKITGFIFRDTVWPLPENLDAFLDNGEAPIAVSFGTGVSYAVKANFYDPFIAAARMLGKRMVILAADHAKILQSRYSGADDLCIATSASHEKLFSALRCHRPPWWNGDAGTGLARKKTLARYTVLLRPAFERLMFGETWSWKASYKPRVQRRIYFRCFEGFASRVRVRVEFAGSG